MQIGKTDTAYPTRMGKLMIAAGLMSHKNLEEALNSAKLMKLPAGRVMIMAGLIDQQTLDSVLLAQSMVREKGLDLESVINLLAEAHQSSTSLEELLSNSGWNSNMPTAIGDLAELFVSATMLSRAEMQAVLKEMTQPGRTLTDCLLSKKLVSTFDLLNGFAAFAMVQHKNLTLPDAIRVLKMAMASGLHFDQALLKCDNVRSNGTIKIGDLLNMSGVLSDTELLEAIETSLIKESLIGEVFVQRGAITRYVLHCTLELQQMLSDGTITLHQAREILLTVNLGKATLEQCIAEFGQFSKAVLDLLVDAGAVTIDNIKTATLMSAGQLLDVAEILFEQGFIERAQLDVARRCQRMVIEEFVTREQAVKILAAYLLSPPGTKPNFEITLVNEISELCQPAPGALTAEAYPTIDEWIEAAQRKQ